MRFALLALLLTACAAAPPEPVPPSAAPCNPDAARHLVGRQATSGVGAEALRLSGARRLRWIRPGDMVTMDYSAERINLRLDAANRVESLACG
jgi:hypothetical protein